MELVKFDYFYIYEHQKDSYVPKHYHNCYELVYYLEGKGSTTYKGETFHFVGSDALIYTPRAEHDEKHDSFVKVACVGFSIDESKASFQDGKYSDRNGGILQIMEKIKDEIKSRQPLFISMVELLINTLLITLNRFQKNNQSQEDDLNYVKEFINENLEYDISINSLVEISGYSYDRFRHLFKEKTGQSPKQYILDKRIAKAKILLSSTDMYVSDIAIKCGFPELSQFSFLFKKKTDYAPLAYRKSIKE